MIAKTSFNTVADISTAAERIEDAHEQGYNDYWDWHGSDGQIVNGNPYEEGSPEHKAYRLGSWEAVHAVVAGVRR